MNRDPGRGVVLSTLPTATAEDVISWRPCADWSHDRIRELSQGRAWTALGICNYRRLPVEVRLWLVLRPQMIPERTLRHLSCDFAERALQRKRKAGREPDPRSWAAVAVGRRYAGGEATKEELAAAAEAAWDAWDAWDDWDAGAATWAAGAAVDAARAEWAAWAAACADGAAAGAAERQWQLRRCRQVLRALEAGQ